MTTPPVPLWERTCNVKQCPLVRREAPVIGTGVEYRAAKDSGAVVVAKNSGIAERVTADEIIIKREDGVKDRNKIT